MILFCEGVNGSLISAVAQKMNGGERSLSTGGGVEGPRDGAIVEVARESLTHAPELQS
jgi:hypothetical protein